MSLLTVMQIAERMQVDVGKILGFIHAGELRAINVAKSKKTRPRWRITEEAFEQFLNARSSRPATEATRQPRRVPSVIPQHI